MITKAIIIDKDIESNKYNVRIPYLESSSGDNTYFKAILSTVPGISNALAPDDVVLVGFEDHQPSSPIILGKLFVDSEDNRGHHSLGSLSVSGRTELSADTYIEGIKLSTFIKEAENDDGSGINSIISIVLDSLYPVGTIYTSTTQVEDTKTVEGKVGCPIAEYGGVWERLEGKFLLGATESGADIDIVDAKRADFKAGHTGGEAAHTLVSPSEIPTHNHVQQGYYTTGSGSSYESHIDKLVIGQTGGGPESGVRAAYTSQATNWGTQIITTKDTGSSGSHNNMPPFLSVYIWKRVA